MHLVVRLARVFEISKNKKEEKKPKQLPYGIYSKV